MEHAWSPGVVPPDHDALERMQQALRAARTAYWEWHADGDRIVLSTEMRALLGLDVEAAAVLAEFRDTGLGAAARAQLESIVSEAMAGDGEARGDVELLPPDGSRRWLRVSVVLEHDADGVVIRANGVAQDITADTRKEQRLAIADAVSHIVATATSLDEAAPEILHAVVEGTEMDVCGLWLPASDGQALRCAYLHADQGADDDLEGFIERTLVTTFAVGEGLPGRVWESGTPMWDESVVSERGRERLEAARTDAVSNGVAVPLRAGSGTVIGVLSAMSRRPSPLDRLLLDTLVVIGDELGHFVRRTRAEAQLRESGDRQRLLVDILQTHRESDDIDVVMSRAAQALGQHVSATRVGFFELVDEETLAFLPGWTASGVEPRHGSWPTSAIGSGFVAEVRKGRTVAIADVREDVLTADSDFESIAVRASIGVPIMRGGQWSAGLYVHQHEPREWGPDVVRTAREVADHTWDAVERLRANAARRESEALARTIADNSTEALVLLDRRGHVRYANAACLAMTGYEGEGIRSKPLHDLIHHHFPDGRPYPAEECPLDPRLERVRLSEHEDVFFRRDGSAFPVICSVSPVFRRGRLDATIIEIRDVSTSKASADALAASEQRYRGTFENAAVGIGHVGLDGRWWRVNRKLCDITGYSEAELLERTFQEITHPDDLEADVQRIDRVLAGEIDTYAIEKRYLRKDGRPVWVEVTVSLHRDSMGEPDYFIGFVIDIGGRKLAESRMRAALAVREEFLGLVSHELRTPMTVIMGMSQLLADGRVGPEQAHEIAGDIAASAYELHEIIESMLLLARLDRDEAALREPLVLARLAADAVARQRTRDPRRRYALTAVPDSLVDANPGLIERVIGNLLGNASKYSANGQDVSVVVETDDEDVILRVLDEGPGLSDAVLAQVFEPFYRAPATDGAPGAGLGLSVAHRIVESLDGRIWVQRRDGGGSEFGFALPRLSGDTE